MKTLHITIRTSLPETAVRRWFVGLGLGVSALLALLALAGVLADSPRFPSFRDYQNANPPMLTVWSCVALLVINPPVLLVALVLAPFTDSVVLQLLAAAPVAIWWWRRLAGVLRVTPITGAASHGWPV
jgi:hypothetical protein